MPNKGKTITRFNIDRDLLTCLYHEEGKDLKTIATIYNVCRQTVQNKMKKYDIPRRHTGVSGIAHPRWKGGRSKRWNGYVQIHLDKTSLFHIMTDHHSMVMEHRLVMAQHLGRPLDRSEVVHHINGKRDDNCLDNLELFSSQKDHLPSMMMQQQIQQFKKEIRLLHWQVKEMQEEIAILKKEIAHARSQFGA